MAEQPQEGATHALGVAETHGARDRLDRLTALLDAGTSSLGAKPFDRLGWGLARFEAECAGELARAEASHRREALDRKRLVQVSARKRQRAPDPIAFRFEVQQRGEL